MSMSCCSGCHRHVMATESNCPFCDAPLRVCRPMVGARKLALMGTSLLAGATLIGCVRSFPAPVMPMYGAPAPPFATPSPSPTIVPSTSPEPTQSP
jgi:uncharacterized paraquat-inducible protein A